METDSGGLGIGRPESAPLRSVGTLGTAIAVGVTAGAGWVWGAGAAGAAGVAAFIAVAVHLLAAQRIRARLAGELRELAAAFLFGMVLRLGGAAVVFGAVLLNRDSFPPLPTLGGYLAVLIPLLFMEIRFLK